MISDTQTLLTHLTTIDAKAARSFPASYDSVFTRTQEIRDAIGSGMTLEQIRPLAIAAGSWAFMGSKAGMNWLDKTWNRLIDSLPAPADEDEIAAHLTASLIEANR